MKNRDPRLLTSEAEIQAELRRMTRRGFVVGGLSAAAAIAGWKWLRSQPEEDGALWPLRRGLLFNEKLMTKLYDPSRPTRTFSEPSDGVPRGNGDLGIESEIDLGAWRLRVENVVTQGGVVELTLDQIRAMPRTEYISYLMCIEGWSDKGHWAGVSFAEFVSAYPPVTRSGRPADVKNNPKDLPKYVGLETPDGEYFVGIDVASALHPQTLLCYEMGGASLTMDHGAPLRLYTPVKYGIKNLKRIGRIFYTDQRPRDYWAMEGYDYFAGL
jgi:DMSO/TMAO reductase YedYZ molybdopterin-dependent catalytic subunit